MSITIAKFIPDENFPEISSKLKISEIKGRKDYVENYMNHLFCVNDGCTAKLVFVQFESLYQKSTFRTYPHSMHSEGCSYHYDNVKDKNPQYSESVFVSLDSKAKMDILLGTHKKATTETLKRDIKLNSQGKTYSVVNKEKSAEISTRFVSTIDPSAESLPKGKRRSKIRRISCERLSEADENKLCAVFGKITDVVITSDSVDIIVNTETSKVVFQFYTPFANNSKAAYELLKNSHDICMKDGLIVAIGIVERSSSGYLIPIMDVGSVLIDRTTIEYYIWNKRQANMDK